MPVPFSYPVTAHRWHLCDASGNSEVCTGMASILCQVQVGRKALLTHWAEFGKLPAIAVVFVTSPRHGEEHVQLAVLLALLFQPGALPHSGVVP